MSNGAASFDGTLQVAFVSGFTPTVGQTFRIVTYTSESGAFDAINASGLPDGLALNPHYNESDLTLEVVSQQGGHAHPTGSSLINGHRSTAMTRYSPNTGLIEKRSSIHHPIASPREKLIIDNLFAEPSRLMQAFNLPTIWLQQS
jgi:hypothetical protein